MPKLSLLSMAKESLLSSIAKLVYGGRSRRLKHVCALGRFSTPSALHLHQHSSPQGNRGKRTSRA